MLEHKIKCSNFCPYNKKLFCPFYVDNEDMPQKEYKQDEIPQKIKTKKYSIKPSPLKKKKNNEGGVGNEDNKNNNVETEWMTFTGEISISNFFTANIEGNMTDLQLGKLQGIALPQEDDSFNKINLTGIIQTNSKECDFGGGIELYLEIINVDKISNVVLTGKFETYYKSGGTVIEPNPPIENPNEITKETEEEKVSQKYYEGDVDFGEFKGTIKLYTSA